ncbi:aldehyde dehydrogenase family protein [Nocardioides sp. cx-173]|uniref:aldehyde dehydrogenase family protein n=1 Tax=Nocardioides sp. cx-173 TaxID=2898796 RepID=UPI001E4EBFA8|nr:aldehyde dehydrogenase family protein [Nocardioides sp. cx-173]MCD4524223.1 aldehyde dehydrogenase family protein [Nocardioides sp. cx-173]UGB41615.1 aldehyde dehydrogenase family protein [Nocardioides sp. cx-173]
MEHATRMLVGGELVQAEGGATYAVENPATGEVIAQVADASAADVQAAITAAREAFDTSDWATDRALRKRAILQLKDAMEAERELFHEELILEAGSPRLLLGSQFDEPVADELGWPAEYIDRYQWERQEADATHPFTGASTHRYVVKAPRGVVAAITAWNFPVQIVLTKIGAALAAGNAVIIKPAIDTPLTALRIARLVVEKTDIPAGILQVVTTSDNAVADLLNTSADVDMVTFTGSGAVGEHILKAAAPTFKKVVLELGGKSAVIALEDADVAAVVGTAMSGSIIHAGQACVLGTRLLVQRPLYDAVVAGLTQAFAAVSPGDPHEPSTLTGPIVNAKQKERILGLIQQGVAEGDRLAAGGEAVDQPGNWVQPTLFVDVDPDGTVAQTEFFGPVLAVIPFDTDDEAIRIANNSRYGLSGYVMSANAERAHAIARRVRSGTIGVNGAGFTGADVPFAGWKASGSGVQGGPEGFEEYVQSKTIGTPFDL